MISQILREARRFEEVEGDQIPSELRPLFHLTPRVGWMNDPNGFSYYNGYYHLFYQYYPYMKKWGPMHWGHAITKDLLSWEFLPAALAPDTLPDSGGCFSGSAIETDDGKHLLMYTGVVKLSDLDEDKFIQAQCLAEGDGIDYVKCVDNPIIDNTNIPEGLSKYDFRDPKIWREADGTYRCVIGGCTEDHKGRILYFKSDNAYNWEFVSVLAENDGSLGTMWECPDFFELDGKYVLLTSPQDCLRTDKYNCGNIVVAMIGTFDPETGKFHKETEQLVDSGIDFYATQTLLSEDGRRIMSAWMQNWDSIVHTIRPLRWFGQMALPREIHVKDGRLFQEPVRELEKLRKNKVTAENVHVNETVKVEGISGRIIDMTVRIRPEYPNSYRKFKIRFAEDETQYTSLTYRPSENALEFDRSHSGTRRATIHTRKCHVADNNGEIKLRIIMDRFSVEVFINDGEQAMSYVIYTDQTADGISFISFGDAVIDVEKYDLSFE
ncbi:MAG: glycoside hydrolase family 32 protein [Solobacterium sp.]|nr:glycoside hydrolase family 32 protein [Solobacterium sp.]